MMTGKVCAPMATEEFLFKLRMATVPITELDLSLFAYQESKKEALSLESLSKFAKTLKRNTSVKTLKLDAVLEAKEFNDPEVQEKAFQCILTILETNQSITTLSLVGLRLSEARVNRLLRALKKSAVSSLDLSVALFEDVKQIQLLIEMMQTKKDFLRLDLRAVYVKNISGSGSALSTMLQEASSRIPISLSLLLRKEGSQKIIFDPDVMEYLASLVPSPSGRLSVLSPTSMRSRFSMLPRSASLVAGTEEPRKVSRRQSRSTL